MLSPQQNILYSLLLQDLTMKEIANKMELDQRTVSTYAINIYKKLGVKSRIGLLHDHYRGILSDMMRTRKIPA